MSRDLDAITSSARRTIAARLATWTPATDEAPALPEPRPPAGGGPAAASAFERPSAGRWLYAVSPSWSGRAKKLRYALEARVRDEAAPLPSPRSPGWRGAGGLGEFTIRESSRRIPAPRRTGCTEAVRNALDALSMCSRPVPGRTTPGRPCAMRSIAGIARTRGARRGSEPEFEASRRPLRGPILDSISFATPSRPSADREWPTTARPLTPKG